MRYAMVPVPIEHVLDVMRFVLDRDDEARVRRDSEHMAALLSEGDDFVRSLLTLVARQTVEDRPSRVTEVAATLGRTDQDVIDAVRRLNADAVDKGLDRVLRLRKDTFDAKGRSWHSLVVWMDPQLADVVAASSADERE